MRAARWSMAVTLTGLVTACAGQGGTGAVQQAEPVVSRFAIASADAPAPADVVPRPVRPGGPAPEPGRPGEARCAWGAQPRPSVDPSASWNIDDARERRRRALAAANPPTPLRGTVPDAAVPGAEACIHQVRLQFSLLTTGHRTVPDRRSVEAVLRERNLGKVVVRPDLTFAASTGAACIHGAFTGSAPVFAIGPLAADGTCRP